MSDKSDIITASKRLLNMEQVCDRLGCSKWSVYRLIDKREIPFIPLGPRLYRFDPDAINKWLDGRAVGTVRDI